jgi:hypothetical protein
MNRKKRVLVLVGSPRGKKSTSTAVGAFLLDLMKNKGLESLEPIWIGSAVRTQEKISQMLEAVESADIIVLAAPLYDDCQPYIVIKAMELIAAEREGVEISREEEADKLFSVIVNCAFPEEHHTETVIRIYRKFAESVGFQWGGSLTIRAGEALQGRTGKTLEELGSMAKKVKGALVQMAESLSGGLPIGNETMCVIPESFSRGPFSFIGSLFIGINNRMWAREAKKKGENVDARPYI